MLATLSLGAMLVVVTSGAFVRLTGSGLGCENWPRCGNTPYPEEGFHAFVEFGNRVVAATGILFALATWLASRKTAGPAAACTCSPRSARSWAGSRRSPSAA